MFIKKSKKDYKYFQEFVLIIVLLTAEFSTIPEVWASTSVVEQAEMTCQALKTEANTRMFNLILCFLNNFDFCFNKFIELILSLSYKPAIEKH